MMRFLTFNFLLHFVSAFEKNGGKEVLIAEFELDAGTATETMLPSPSGEVKPRKTCGAGSTRLA